MRDSKHVNTFYSKDSRKSAVINSTPDFIYVEFYQDDVIVGGVEVKDKSIYYAESIAENFCNDILKVNPWSTNESIESHLCWSNRQ